MKALKTIGALLCAVVAVLAYMCLAPLDNDAEQKQAGIKYHDAMQELRSYHAFQGNILDTDKELHPEQCPKCSPTTWRLNRRLSR